MQKDQGYHESAIAYNEGLAEFAENLVPSLKNEEVKRWCTAVGKQHRFHAKRHRSALNKLLLKQAAPPVEVLADGLDVPPPSEGNEVSVTEVEEIVESDTPALADGCSPFHDPTRPTCEFYPKSGG
jgi:hypothetical protein